MKNKKFKLKKNRKVLPTENKIKLALPRAGGWESEVGEWEEMDKIDKGD